MVFLPLAIYVGYRFDYLKIDGDLIRNIDKEEYIQTIVDMVNQVAIMMGMKTIAEFC